MTRSERARLWAREPLSRRSWGFDVGLALLATGAELALLLDDGTASSVALALTGVGGGAVALRRRAPLAVLAATLAAVVAIVAVGETPGGITVLIALYTTAAICERSVSLAALLPTAVVVTAVSVVTAEDGHPSSVVVGAVAAAPLTAGIWGLGAYAQTRRRYTQALEERAAQLEREREQLALIAVQEERTAIARELHDIVAHSVSVMLVGVRGAREAMRRSPDVAQDVLKAVERSGEQSLQELRRVLAVLRAADDGAESRPQPSLDDLGDLIEGYRAAGLPVRLDVLGEPAPLPGGLELSVYRIVQEALTNAIKHADPSRVTVMLRFGGARLDVEISDDGTPSPEPSSRAHDDGHGLIGMRERVALFGGTLTAEARPGGGFDLVATLPYGEPA
jgi:signal transduction histidine kinase